MSLMGGTDLGVTVDANVSPYERNIERAKRATNSYERSLESLDADIRGLEKSLADEADKALRKHHDALDKTGKAMFVFGAAVAAGFALATGEAIKWESAFTGVTKTTNGNAAQMADLEDDLRSLARTLPSTHEEIAATAEAAGQLGVKRKDIASFTKVMLDLGQTTNLTADEAATSIAQLMNAMDSAPDIVDRIGNTLVDLGNKGASTEADILEQAKRIAGAGALVGASESDVLGLASALANLGIKAELGGGATQRVLLNLYTSMKEGGEQAEKFADIAGVSAERFAREWESDPIQAFNMLVKGMGRIQDEGGNLVTSLEDVGIRGTQNLQVMLRLAGAGDELTDSLKTSTSAWEKNNALVKEAEKRYETTESKILVARNQMRDAAIDIGGVLLPVLAQVVETGSDLVRTWADMPGPVKNVIVVLGILTGATALAGGAALIAVPKIFAFKKAVEALDAGKTKSAGKGIMALGSFLTGPWGVALSVATIGMGYFAAKQGEAARKVDELTDTLDKQSGAITDNTRELIINQLQKDGVLDAGRKLGIDLGVLTDAMLGNSEAIALVNEQMGVYDEHSRVGLSAAAAKIDQALGGNNETLEKSRRQWELENEAMGGSADASDDAAGSMSKLPPILDDTADAAGDAAGEIEALGDELTELSENFFANRDAGRAIRDTLREIRKATREYIKEHKDLDGAFKAGTKSGDDFAGLLDQLAQDYLEQISATEELTGSQKKTMDVYRDSRQRLIEVAQQLGLTKKEAEKYANTVLGTPAEAKTHFIQIGLDQAKQDTQNYTNALLNVPASVFTTFYTHHEEAADNGGHSPPPGGGGGGGGGSHDRGLKPYSRSLTGGIWGAANAGSQQRRFTPAGAGGSGGVDATRALMGLVDASLSRLSDSRQLIGQLTVPAMPGASGADVNRVVDSVVNAVSLAERSGRWARGGDD